MLVRAFRCTSCEGRSLLDDVPDFGCEFVRVLRIASTSSRGYFGDLAMSFRNLQMIRHLSFAVVIRGWRNGKRTLGRFVSRLPYRDEGQARESFILIGLNQKVQIYPSSLSRA